MGRMSKDLTWKDVRYDLQNGIQDLINDKGPREKDPYIFLLFNCPEYFFKKY